jgi:uncharacterized protein YbjT (DUF2867 family)
MRVAVAGGTGSVRRHVVRALEQRGHEPVVLARSTGVDLRTGRGLDASLEGVEAVIDLTDVAVRRRRKAVAVLTRMTRTLLQAEQRAGVRAHVLLSIVGTDRIPFGYYAGRLAQERLVLEGPVPATVLRTTHLNEHVERVVGMGQGPVALVPRVRIQPVAAREVAQTLAELVEEAPAGRVQELAGPRVHDAVDLARRMVHARGAHRIIVPVRLPGPWGHAVRVGLLPGRRARRGGQTFREWLEDPARLAP